MSFCRNIAQTTSAIFLVAVVSVLLTGCSPMRFLADDETLLSRVSLQSDNRNVAPEDYRGYIRQEANSRWFNLVKVPLGLYCMSRADSTKRSGRIWKRLGQAPVVYDSVQTEQSVTALRAALRTRGYLKAEASAESNTRKRRTKVRYQLLPGDLWTIDSVVYESDDSTMLFLLHEYARETLLHKGSALDVAVLSQERDRIIGKLQNNGYFAINKDYIAFTADTLPGRQTALVHLTLSRPEDVSSSLAYRQHTFRDINIYEGQNLSDSANVRTLPDFTIHYEKRQWLHSHVYENHTALLNGALFAERDVQATYAGLGALQAVAIPTIRVRPVPLAESDSLHPQLDAHIVVTPAERYTISAEVDGTNTNGDLGAAVSLNFTNRNAFHGAEVLSLKLRGAYEAIKGLEGYKDQNYTEYSAEISLRMPTFKFPLMPRKLNKELKAVSELGIMYNSQDRPEFHRRILTGRWAYTWQHHNDQRWQHTIDVLNLNYVFLPWISETFRTEYLEGTNARSSILRNTYENLLIMRIGYSFVFNSRKFAPLSPGMMGWQLRFNVETAGNLLYGASCLGVFKKDVNKQYEAFGIPFSQYAKIDLDYSTSFAIDKNNSLSFHALFGLAIPYGNSLIIPYEKRYFAGGANGVRGWNVRELGPGSYHTSDGKVNFINQTGNLQLLLSLEYRTRLFWKFSGAAFIDAGNIWNTRRYDDIPHAHFKFDKFWNQIAVAYGIGLRFNMDYFILRFDAGMKAINPAVTEGKGHYPIAHPKLSRDFALHFAVGLPF